MQEGILYGHVGKTLGVGEAGRRLARLLSACGLKIHQSDVGLSKAHQEQDSFDSKSGPSNLDFVVSAVNADQTAATMASMHLSDLLQRQIGFWAWELEDFPKQFRAAAYLLDEIWSVSTFSTQAIGNTVKTKTTYVKLPVPIPSVKTTMSKNALQLPASHFTALAAFDYASDFSRKNPIGIIDAYTNAFPKEGSALLVIKTLSSEMFPEEHAFVQEKVANRDDIIFKNEYMSKIAFSGLIQNSDVYLSLHRSEGYGLNLVDSMACGTPVIATGYSGNLDFMDEESSILVPYSLTPVARYAGIKVDSYWAEPDLDFAAKQLRKLAESKALQAQLGVAARTKIRLEHSLPVAVNDFLGRKKC